MLNSAKNDALSFLVRRERSEQEMREFLASKNHGENDIEKVIDYLYYFEYLDDEAYAGKYIRDKINFYPCGSEKLRLELEKKGIATSIIEQSLEENFNDEQELALAKDLLIKKKSTEIDVEKKRRYLYQKGFSLDVVFKATGEDA